MEQERSLELDNIKNDSSWMKENESTLKVTP